MTEPNDAADEMAASELAEYEFPIVEGPPIPLPDGSTMTWEEIENEALLNTGTCQRCGAYWDMRQRTTCTCGGEVL